MIPQNKHLDLISSLFPRQQALPSPPFPEIQMIPQFLTIHEHVSTKTTIQPHFFDGI